MTFRQLAFRNIRGSWQRYAAYFLSCVCSVVVFYLFASFIAHPGVMTGYIVGGGRAGVTQGLYVAEVIIMIFSFFFILYSITAFLRSRKQELGLFTLMGMTAGQLRRMLVLESAAIGGSALVVGLSLGILFSKLFFMAMSVLLQTAEPIPFLVPQLAVGATLVIFCLLFGVLTFAALAAIRQSNILSLLRAKRVSLPLPTFNRLAFLLGVALIGFGYRLAVVTDGRSFMRNMLPIIGMVVAGTFLLVAHGSVACCRVLQQRHRTVWNGTNVVLINRLVFRLRQNANVIFVTAVLIAVICSALGALTAVWNSARADAMKSAPYAISFVLDADDQTARSLAGQVRAALERQSGRPVVSGELAMLMGRVSQGEAGEGVRLVSLSEYNQIAAKWSRVQSLQLAPGEGVLLGSGGLPQGVDLTSPFSIAFGGRSLTVERLRLEKNSLPAGRMLAVLADREWQTLNQAQGQTERLCLYEYPDWVNLKIGDAVHGVLGQAQVSRLIIRAEYYYEVRQACALTMFIGAFVSLLFFVATASLVYFKLFTEADEDRQQFRILQQIGISKGELRRIVNRELGTVFFLPMLIGASHTAFALRTLTNLSPNRIDIWTAGLTVGAIYLTLQLTAFLLVRISYQKQMIQI